MQPNPSGSGDGSDGRDGSAREAEIAWAAGLFEGEGCFNAYCRVTKWQTAARLSMTDRDVVERFAVIIGVGAVRGPLMNPHKPEWKPTWEWYVTRAASVRIVVALLLPWLGERRTAKALEVDAIAATIVPHGERTHCPAGHSLSGENLMIEPIRRNGRPYEARRCKICRRKQVRECMRRRKEASNPKV